MRAQLKVVEIDNLSGFLALREEWNDVLSRCDHSIFSTWEWLTCWWKYFGINKKLFLLLGEKDNQIVGIAPLMYSVYEMFGARMGKIEFIGTPDSDYHDFVLVEEEEECITNFINHLNRFPMKWNCIDLSEIPESSKSLRFLAETSRTLKPVHKCPYTSLPRSHDIFLRSLSHKKRKDLQRNLKRLEKEFEVNFADYSGSQSCVKGMNEFFELHQRREESKGFSGIFSIQTYRNFHFEIARSFSRKGWLRLYILKLSGKSVAALYGFRYQKKFYFYLSGFDPKYSPYSIENLLMSKAIEKSIQEELTEFDFMRGAEKYKDRWNTTTRWNHEAIIIQRGFLENVEYRLYDKYWQQASQLKYFVKNAPRILAHVLNK
jgi:CelD/BcsL family acetyltransferase involved in cellulose biosynthesis